jgi:xylulokinase
MSTRALADVLLGIDIGTSGCKAAAYSDRGRLLGSGYVAYELCRPAPGTVEQDPACWWDAAVIATRQAVAQSRGAVRAVALSSTNALVMLGARDEPTRPAIMQLDRRAVAAAAELDAELGPDAAERLGGRPSAGMHWLPALRWLRDNEPDRYRSTSSLLFPTGLIALRMTGERRVDYSRAATTLMLDQRSRSWSREALAAVDADERWLPALTESAETIGLLRPTAASELGLPAGIPVCVGSMDSAAAALGVGLIRVGDVVIALGTTARIMCLTPDYRPGAGIISCPYPAAPFHLMIGVVWGAGSALRWAASQWTGTPDFARLEQLAAGPHAEAPTARISTDEFSPAMSGGKANPAERAGAVLSGVACDLRERADSLRRYLGQRISSVLVTGGWAHSAALIRRISNELSVPVRSAHNLESETRGAALLAGVASGRFPDVPSAIAAMSSPGAEA